MNVAARIGCFAAVPLLACWPVADSSAIARQTNTTVVVTVTDRKLELSRKSVPAGLVVFEVRNSGKHRHRVEIAGNETPELARSGTATLKIVFVRGGTYRLGAAGLSSGVLRVIPGVTAPTPAPTSTVTTATTPAPPCANPTASTVTVTMTDKPVPDGYSFSPTSAACGTVTFILTNSGKLGHGLDLMDPRGQILPPSSTVGSGQTMSITENLRYAGTYEWADIISDAFGEDGVGELVVH